MWISLQRLLDGNRRYVAARFRYQEQLAAQRQAAIVAERPFAAVLGCSDSRVPVEMVFDQGLGDLFVVRVAGNLAADREVIGSLEYAVIALGVQLIVVLGHERCGALSSAVAAVQEGIDFPGHIGRLVDNLRPAALAGCGLPGDVLDNAVRANVEQGVAYLAACQPLLATAVAEGRLQIVGAHYNLDTGVVDIITPAERNAAP